MTLTRKVQENRITYTVNNSRKFIPQYQLNINAINRCIDFAYAMSFGAQGEHRANRSGGRNVRSNGEIFCDAFNGKLGEFAIHQYLANQNIYLPEPDLEVYGRGRWDDTDFLYNGYHLSVKTTKHIGNLLLLERDDWDQNGHYIPNYESPSGGRYDAIILVRVDSDIVKLFKNNKKYYDNVITRKELDAMLNNFSCSFDIPGYADLASLQQIITNNQIIEQGSYLGQYTRMDATNYYIQSGNLTPISHLIHQLGGDNN